MRSLMLSSSSKVSRKGAITFTWQRMGKGQGSVVVQEFGAGGFWVGQRHQGTEAIVGEDLPATSSQSHPLTACAPSRTHLQYQVAPALSFPAADGPPKVGASSCLCCCCCLPTSVVDQAVYLGVLPPQLLGQPTDGGHGRKIGGIAADCPATGCLLNTPHRLLHARLRPAQAGKQEEFRRVDKRIQGWLGFGKEPPAKCTVPARLARLTARAQGPAPPVAPGSLLYACRYRRCCPSPETPYHWRAYWGCGTQSVIEPPRWGQ